jgi:hypothetical protein
MNAIRDKDDGYSTTNVIPASGKYSMLSLSLTEMLYVPGSIFGIL